MIGYDRRPAEAMKENTEEEFRAPAWLFPLVMLTFAIHMIIAYA